jgi:5-dehydro-2-deoxygluconokinase
MATWPELDLFLKHGPRRRRLREDTDLEHLHWATTRRRDYPELCVLAMDHRSQFEDLAAALGADPSRIATFKSLGLAAARRVAGGEGGFGMLLDGRFGARALEATADDRLWISRPIEEPGSRPLAFEGGDDVAITLREWPLSHVVKCLVRWRPDDAADLKARQGRQLLRLYDACRATRHELLAEIIASGAGAVGPDTVARAIGEIYALGVRPDWWKLEPSADPRAWAETQQAIRAHDPLCRGVLVLGLGSDARGVMEAFRAAAPFDIVKGFAVGRTVFEAPARLWLSGEIDDAEAVDQLTVGFAALVRAWRAARSDALARPAAE